MAITGLIKNIVVDATAVSTGKSGIVANVILPDGDNAVVWINATTLRTLFPNLMLQVKGIVSSALLTLAAKGQGLAVEYREVSDTSSIDYDVDTAVKQGHYSAVLKGADPIDTALLSLAIDLLETKLRAMPTAKMSAVTTVSIVKEHREDITMYSEMYSVTGGTFVDMVSTLLTGHYNELAATVDLNKKSAAAGTSGLVNLVTNAKNNTAGDVVLTTALNNILVGLRNGSLDEAAATTQYESVIADAMLVGIDLTA